MLTTCALLTLLSVVPSQENPAPLKLTNIRVTTGILGPVRTSLKLLPGDLLYVSYDIENLQIAANGEVKWNAAIEFRNTAGKVQYQDSAQGLSMTLALGNARMPQYANVEVGSDTPEGKYILKVTIADAKREKEKQSFEQEFEVVKKGFGLVRAQLSYRSGEPAPMFASVGQVVLANCLVVGYDRDKNTKAPHLQIEVNVVDAETSKSTLAKPEVLEHKLGDGAPIDIHWPLDCSRPGKFRIELKVTDVLTKKSDSLSFPVTILENK